MKKILTSTAIIFYAAISQTVTPHAKAAPQASEEGVEPSHSCHTRLPEGFLERKFNETTDEDKLNKLKKKLVECNVNIALKKLNITEENLPIFKEGVMEAKLPTQLRMKTMHNLSTYYFQIEKIKEALILGVSAIQEEWLDIDKVTNENETFLTNMVDKIGKNERLSCPSSIQAFIHNFEGNEAKDIPPFFSMYVDVSDYEAIKKHPIPALKPYLDQLQSEVINGKFGVSITKKMKSTYIEHLYNTYHSQDIEPYLRDEEIKQRQNALSFLLNLTKYKNNITGDVGIINEIGHLYYEGKGTKQDAQKAAEYWEKAVDLGDTQSLLNLALIYQGGHGVKENMDKVIQYYKKAWNAGKVEAYLNLGKIYFSRKESRENIQNGKKFLKKALEEGNAEAAYYLGKFYFTGGSSNKKYAQKNYGLAKKFLEIASKADFPKAHYYLSVLYTEGLGVKKSLEKAAKYCQKAPKDPLAQSSLGYAYYHGKGVPQDKIKALECYIQATESGDEQDYENFYAMYYSDQQMVLDYFNEAAISGDEKTYQKLDSILEECKRINDERLRKAKNPSDDKKVSQKWHHSTKKRLSDRCRCFKKGH